MFYERFTQQGNSHNYYLQKLSLCGYILSIGILLGSASSLHRSYQDSWVLENLLPQILLVILFFSIYVVNENRLLYIVISVCLFIFSVRALPGFKYINPYGSAIDQSVHWANIQEMSNFGIPEHGNVYSDEPGIYILLIALNLLGNVTTSSLLRFGPAFFLSLSPFFIYIIGKSISKSNDQLRFIVISCVFIIDPYFLVLQGSTFGTFLFTILVALISNRNKKYQSSCNTSWTILLIIGLYSLTITHAITSFITGVVLLVIWGFHTFYNKVFNISQNERHKGVYLTANLGILSLVITLSWWIYKANLIINIVVEKSAQLLVNFLNPIRPPIPPNFFSLNSGEQMVILSLYHLDFILVILLSVIGFLILLGSSSNRASKLRKLFIPLTMQIIFISILFFQLVFKIGQIEYSRFISYILIFSPIFIGETLSVFEAFLKHHHLTNKIRKFILSASFMSLIIVAFIQAFPYQPIVPKRAIINDSESQPIVYLHTVLSNNQISMLQFVKNHLPPDVKIGADIVTFNSAIGFWGIEQTQIIHLQRALPTEPIQNGKWNIFLYHRPGAAGPLFEQLEYRNLAVNPFLSLPTNWSVPYDNGGSFVISR
jgi:hypothetical protein